MVRPSCRPQRGLPKNSVSVLRAWLFEYFLHPYLEECEKMTLQNRHDCPKTRISTYFCLFDTIKEQIQLIREKLGEKEKELSLDEQQGERIARLRYLDQRLRQQRALHQQLGMVRPSCRPQRGFPKNSVSVLRAWLFEYFLHPYLEECEKIETF
ncbi:hypothetical protein F2Q70_00031131 [Brassica cretica]|uniref:Uncharacterized protein n=1 Tax=Brassica cretica TaxID=69181 RepID=A0A8S9FK31_BRACR|nr:hypothetical protein F2Q70_00031131 [Brassica cretica]